VAVPRDLDELSALVVWAEEEGLPLVPRGAGTGMPGGNVGRGVVVDLTGLDQLGEVEEDSQGRLSIGVGAGVVAARVEARARAEGAFLPPLPSSADRCTLGGMIANNAAGPRTFRHGAMRDWIEELEVVTTGGEVHTLRSSRSSPWTDALHERLLRDLGAEPGPWPRVRKNSSGYALERFLPSGDALQLVLGSEGTLGMVTRARVRLQQGPEDRALVLLALRDSGALPDAALLAREVEASACEMLGRRVVQMAGLDHDPRFAPLADQAVALLLVELAGPEELVLRGRDELLRFAREVGTAALEARDDEDALALWELRHRASPAIATAAARGLRSTQFIEDSVVPVETLSGYLTGLHDILGRAGTDAVIFGHLGDGHLHVNPLIDLGRDAWPSTVRRILEETVALVASLGGTLSGEHGDGRIRAPYLERIWAGPVVAAFREVKRSLDPGGIFNPGVVLPVPGQDPLEGMWWEGPEGLGRPGSGAELAPREQEW